MTFFLLWNMQWEILNNVLVVFHAIVMNGNWSFQASKRIQLHQKLHEMDHMTCAQCFKKSHKSFLWQTTFLSHYSLIISELLMWTVHWVRTRSTRSVWFLNESFRFMWTESYYLLKGSISIWKIHSQITHWIC